VATKQYYQRWKAKKLAADPDFFKHDYQRRLAWLGREKMRSYGIKSQANNAESIRASKYAYRRRNPEKNRAQVYAQRYTPLKDKCEICGSTANLQRHHPDYSKPLEVLTLCGECNRKAESTSQIDKQVLDRHCNTCSKTWPACGKRHKSLKGYACALWEDGEPKIPLKGQLGHFCENCAKSIPETCNRKHGSHITDCVIWESKSSFVTEKSEKGKDQ